MSGLRHLNNQLDAVGYIVPRTPPHQCEASFREPSRRALVAVAGCAHFATEAAHEASQSPVKHLQHRH